MEISFAIGNFFHNFSISWLRTLSDGLFNAVFFLFISVLDYPCNLLQIDKEFLATKLTSRVMKTTWGGKTEEVVVTNNIQQAESTRDALAKGIYSRIFDFLVEVWDHPFKTSANFHDFWPLPPYHQHSTKMLMKGIFDPYVLWPFDHRHIGTPLPP